MVWFWIKAQKVEIKNPKKKIVLENLSQNVSIVPRFLLTWEQHREYTGLWLVQGINGSALNPFLYTLMMENMTNRIGKEFIGIMMFVDNVYRENNPFKW